MEDAVRVRVSLERFFSDERAHVYMCARPSRPVRWLLRRLRRAFPDLPPVDLALRSAGHLLPPAEPLSILRHDDPIEVIQVKSKDINQEPQKCEPVRIPQETVEEEEADEVDTGGAGDAELNEMKRHALSLLNGFEEEESGVPKRRRRVRRRRRAADGDVPFSSEYEQSLGEQSHSEQLQESTIVQNGSPRAPRLIHALPSSFA